MSRLASLLAGVGLGAATGYARDIERKNSDERIEAYRKGEKAPPQQTPLEALIGKFKGDKTQAAPPDISKAAPAVPAPVISTAQPVPTPVAPEVAAPAAPQTRSMDTSSPTYQVTVPGSTPVVDGQLTPEQTQALPRLVGDEHTEAFSDNKTVTDAPAPFVNSYQNPIGE